MTSNPFCFNSNHLRTSAKQKLFIPLRQVFWTFQLLSVCIPQMDWQTDIVTPWAPVRAKHYILEKGLTKAVHIMERGVLNSCCWDDPLSSQTPTLDFGNGRHLDRVNEIACQPQSPGFRIGLDKNPNFVSFILTDIFNASLSLSLLVMKLRTHSKNLGETLRHIL